MGHSGNIQYLERLYEKMQGKPGAGSIKQVLADYKKLLSNRQEVEFLENADLVYLYLISLVRHGLPPIKCRIKSFGTYTLIVDALDVDSDKWHEMLVYKHDVSRIVPVKE